MSALDGDRETVNIIASRKDLVASFCAAARRRQGRSSSLRCGRSTLTARTPAAVWLSTRSLAACAFRAVAQTCWGEGGRLPTKSASAWIVHVVTARTEPTYGKRSRP